MRAGRLIGSGAVLAACLACGTGGVPASAPPPSEVAKAEPTAPLSAPIGATVTSADELAAHAVSGSGWGDAPTTQRVADAMRRELAEGDPRIGVAVRLVEGSPVHFVVVVRGDVADGASYLSELLEIARSYGPYPAEVGVATIGESGWTGVATWLGGAETTRSGRGDVGPTLAPLFVAGTSGAQPIALLAAGDELDVLAQMNRAMADDEEEDEMRFRYTTLDCPEPTHCRLGVAISLPGMLHRTTLDVRGFTTLRENGFPSESFVTKSSEALSRWAETLE